MNKSLQEIAQTLGIHYTTLQKLSTSISDFPVVVEYEGSRRRYDEEVVCCWYIMYKARDKRAKYDKDAGLSLLVVEFSKNIGFEYINGSQWFNLDDVYNKIGVRKGIMPEERFRTENFNGSKFICLSMLKIFAILYAKSRGDFFEKNKIPYMVDKYIAKAKAATYNHKAQPTKFKQYNTDVLEDIALQILQDEIL